MKAVGITPRQAHTARLVEVPMPSLDKIPNGRAAAGYDFLVTGHESFGKVVEVGPKRRPGHSIYDQIGTYDMTSDDTYYERGINLRHGYTTEYYVDDPEYIVKVPPGLKGVGVLLEPMSIVEKGIYQAHEIQRRLKVWQLKSIVFESMHVLAKNGVLVLSSITEATIQQKSPAIASTWSLCRATR